MEFMRRRLPAIATLLSLLLCSAIAVIWVRSCAWSASDDATELPARAWRVETCRGKFVLMHNCHNAAPAGLWLVTTVHLGWDGEQRTALIKALVCDPSAPRWDPSNPAESQLRLKSHLLSGGKVLSRPYVSVQLAPARSARNLGGFALNVVRLDLPQMAEGPPQGWRYVKSRPVLWSVAIPMWLPAALVAVVPLHYGVRTARRRRRRRHGRCATCGYDLRATAGCCPECGASATSSAPARRASQRSGSCPDVSCTPVQSSANFSRT